jgi:hypothetical protein
MSDFTEFQTAGPRKSNSPRQESSDTNAPPSFEEFIGLFPRNWRVNPDTYCVFFKDWMPTADVEKFQKLVDDLNESKKFRFHFHLVRRSGYNFIKKDHDGNIIFSINDGDLCLLTSDQLSDYKEVKSFISVKDDNFNPLYQPVPERVETHEPVQDDEPTLVEKSESVPVPAPKGAWSRPVSQSQPSFVDAIRIAKEKYEEQQQKLFVQQKKTQEAREEWERLYKEHQTNLDSLVPPVQPSEEASEGK